jgi:hypothetical protein
MSIITSIRIHNRWNYCSHFIFVARVILHWTQNQGIPQIKSYFPFSSTKVFTGNIKHYFFSQFYNYKKNKSLQIKAFIVNLNPDTDVLSTSVSFITRYKLMNYTQKTSSWYYLSIVKLIIRSIDWIYLFSLPLTFLVSSRNKKCI